jgi:hypothetical protein
MIHNSSAEYEWGFNPIKDLIFQAMLLDYDLKDEKTMAAFRDNIISLLEYVGVDDRDIKTYLDFKFHFEDVKVIPMPNNFITALWFIAIFPEDCDTINKNNVVEFDHFKYSFDHKNKKLKTIKI